MLEDKILEALDKINKRLDNLEAKLSPSMEERFDGIKLYISAEEIPGNKEGEPLLWGWETTLIIPGRPTLSQRGSTVVETNSNQKPLILGIYAGLQQCWIHPAMKKGIRIILDDSTLITLLKSREKLEGVPYDDKDLAEKFLSLVGLLRVFPGVEIEHQQEK